MGTVYDVLVLLVLVFEFLLGFLDGYWVRLLRLLGLVLAIYLSGVLTGPVCTALPEVSPITSIQFGLFCWMFILMAVVAVCWLMVRWVEHAQDKKNGGTFFSATSHIFGALLGGLHGLVLVLVITWGYGMVRVNFTPRSPSFETARLMPVVERVHEAVAFASIFPSVEPEYLARRIAWHLGHPGRTMQQWDSLLQEDCFGDLLDSDSFWKGVLTGDEWGVQANGFFQNVLHDKAAMRALRLLVFPVQYYEPAVEPYVLARQLAAIGRAYERIHDKEKVMILVDALKAEHLFAPDVRAGLITDMRFVRLVIMIMREAAQGTDNG